MSFFRGFALVLMIRFLLVFPFISCRAQEAAGVSISAEQLGLSLSLVPLCPGEAVLTVCNTYSESAEIVVSVSEELTLTYSLRPFEAPAARANVLDFGADGTDQKDDTQAIQRAIDSLTEGGTVYLPGGCTAFPT